MTVGQTTHSAVSRRITLNLVTSVTPETPQWNSQSRIEFVLLSTSTLTLISEPSIKVLSPTALAYGRPSGEPACGNSPAQERVAWLPSPPATASGLSCMDEYGISRANGYDVPGSELTGATGAVVAGGF
jgi:hypothetical protein